MSIDAAGIPDLIGIVGVSVLLVAYFLSQMGKWSFNSFSYLISNFMGAFLILISLFYHWNLPAFLIEVMWCCISVYGMVKVTCARKQQA